MKIKHYLIASETNNYRPWITSTWALFFFTVIVWGLRIILPASLTLAATYLDPVDLMNRINNERYQRNITTVVTDNRLITAAQGKAGDMMARSYFSHIDPDGNYVWPRIEAAGFTPYSMLGENLAMDFTSPDDLIAAWMNSPTHRANLLNSKFDYQGLALTTGLYEPSHDSTVVVSLFGTLAQKTAGATQNTSATNAGMTIGADSQVSVTQVSGHDIVNMDVPVSGNPKLVTARLLTQSITLLPQGNGHFAGTFTFNLTDNLSNKPITVEARDAAGNKVDDTINLGTIDSPTAESAPGTGSPVVPAPIPISRQAQIIEILRIVFGILSLIYLGFLVTDWVILKRAHIQRPGMLVAPQIVIFMIVAAVNIFAKF